MPAPEVRESLPITTEADRIRFRAEFVDDVLSKLSDALFEVAEKEGWTKRDIAARADMDETMVGRLLAGRRPNMKVETIAVLARALRRRPELFLHDDRPEVTVSAETVTTSSALSGSQAWDGVEHSVISSSHQLAGAE